MKADKEFIKGIGLLALIIFLLALAITCIGLTIIGIIKGYI